MKQDPVKSAKEFSDEIKEKLKELSEKIRSQYDHVEVLKSFDIEHEKIAIRTFREGLRPPLKYRMVNATANTLDEITKKAVEEEPYVAILKSSFDSKPDSKPNPNDKPDEVIQERNLYSERFRNSRFNRNLTRYPYDRQNWRPNNNFYRRDTPYPRRNFNNNFLRTIDQTNMTAKDNRPSTTDQSDGKNVRFCIRCNRNGHLSDNCYARLNNASNSDTENGERFLNRIKQISFLEVPHKRKNLNHSQSRDNQVNKK